MYSSSDSDITDFQFQDENSCSSSLSSATSYECSDFSDCDELESIKIWKPSRFNQTRSWVLEEKNTVETFQNMRSILNKLTPEKFIPLMQKVKNLEINTEERIHGVVDLIYKKAVREPLYSEAYANLCRGMFQLWGNSPLGLKLYKVLIFKCEIGFKKEITKNKDLQLQSKQPKMHLEEKERPSALQRILGNIRFIGELFKLKMLNEKVMHECIVSLFGCNDENSLRGLCYLLTGIGKDLDHQQENIQMEQYFFDLDKIVKEKNTSSRVRFLIQDVIDLRANKWVLKEIKFQRPKTIAKIHEDFEKEKGENAFPPCDIQECWEISKQNSILQTKLNNSENLMGSMKKEFLTQNQYLHTKNVMLKSSLNLEKKKRLDLINQNWVLTCTNESFKKNMGIKKRELEEVLTKNANLHTKKIMLESSLNIKEKKQKDLLKQNLILETKNQTFKNDMDIKKKENADLKEENERLQKKINDSIAEKPITYHNPKTIFCASGTEGSLGSGAYGCVRLAFTKAWGAVAIKCIVTTGSKLETDEIHKQIRNECQMLQLSNHINVVRVIGYTTWPKSAGILMEYMLGGNLSSLLLHRTEVQIIPPAIRLRFVSNISSGLAFMHNLFASQRVTHGDLKVHNILVTDDLTCKISDFGGAHFGTCTAETSASPSSHKIINTQVFLAPEALQNPHLKFCKSTDVYSFSMIVYMILTRKTPYENFQINTYLEYIKLGKRPSVEAIKDLKDTLNDEDDIEIINLLQTVMENCWEHSPNERPLIIDIRDCLQKKLFTIDLCTIQEYVCKIVRKLKFKNPCQNYFNCHQIDKFSPPHFQFTE